MATSSMSYRNRCNRLCNLLFEALAQDWDHEKGATFVYQDRISKACIELIVDYIVWDWSLLKVGMQVDCLDAGFGRFARSTILEVVAATASDDEGKEDSSEGHDHDKAPSSRPPHAVLIHYDGWESMWDIWIHFDRLAFPPSSHGSARHMVYSVTAAESGYSDQWRKITEAATHPETITQIQERDTLELFFDRDPTKTALAAKVTQVVHDCFATWLRVDNSDDDDDDPLVR